MLEYDPSYRIYSMYLHFQSHEVHLVIISLPQSHDFGNSAARSMIWPRKFSRILNSTGGEFILKRNKLIIDELTQTHTDSHWQNVYINLYCPTKHLRNNIGKRFHMNRVKTSNKFLILKSSWMKTSSTFYDSRPKRLCTSDTETCHPTSSLDHPITAHYFFHLSHSKESVLLSTISQFNQKAFFEKIKVLLKLESSDQWAVLFLVLFALKLHLVNLKR